jgi:TM2 domain-containing membrane protein YozV
MPKDMDKSELPDKDEFVAKKTTAAICAILLGAFGVHKFILGNTTPAIIMLVMGISCCLLPVSQIIGLIEGIMYLTKSDDDFYQQYAVDKKGWF